MALYAIKKGYKHAAFVFSTEPSAQTLKPIVLSHSSEHLGGTATTTVTSPRTVLLPLGGRRVIASHPRCHLHLRRTRRRPAPCSTTSIEANNFAIPFVGIGLHHGQ